MDGTEIDFGNGYSVQVRSDGVLTVSDEKLGVRASKRVGEDKFAEIMSYLESLDKRVSELEKKIKEGNDLG